jgi:recombination protein RecR
MAVSDIDRLVQMLAKLPGLGPRSARRAALFLLTRKEQVLSPLADALARAAQTVRSCSTCHNLDTTDPCAVCANPLRDPATICVVEQVADLWAIERTSSFRGRYHVLGGVLSPLDGVGPDDLAISDLVERVKGGTVREVVLATSATVDGRTTAHYIADRLAGIQAAEANLEITALARGIPVGGELDYLDDGTLASALKDRRAV